MKQKIKDEKTEFESFREFLKDMRRGFPRWEYRDLDKKFVPSQFKILLKEKFFIEMDSVVSDGEEHRMFILGSPLLSLISAWENEDLTRQMRKLTIWIIALTVINTALFLAQTLKIFGAI